MKKINKKNYYIIISVILIIVFLIIGIIYINREEEVVNDIKEIIPTEEISDEQLRSTIISLYYINKNTGEIEVENKKIDSKKILNNTYNEILNMWINGPESNNLMCGCSKDTKINNIEIKNNCAVIDFSKEFLDNKDNVDELKNIYCIVNTLTELKEINCVKILIDGEENVYYGNINLSEKYIRLNE